MMHGAEKSDSPIVPMKLANKAGRAAAEPVEGRGGTKGNADCKARSGRRAGKPCHRRGTAYEKRSTGTRRRS